MKKLFFFLLLPVILTSCQITEDVTFHKNGSGSYNFNVDMSSMMQMMKGMGKKNDSLKTPKKLEKKDTTIYFSAIIEKNKDSIAKLSKDERKTLLALKDAKIRINLDEEKGKMLMQYVIPFKNIADLDHMTEKLKHLNSFNKKNEQGMENIDDMMPQAEITYRFNKHQFHRIVKVKKSADQKKTANDQNKLNEMMKMFRYKLVYHFPYKIASTTYKQALIGADGQSIHIEVPIDSLMKNPKLLDFKVKFQ